MGPANPSLTISFHSFYTNSFTYQGSISLNLYTTCYFDVDEFLQILLEVGSNWEVTRRTHLDTRIVVFIVFQRLHNGLKALHLVIIGLLYMRREGLHFAGGSEGGENLQKVCRKIYTRRKVKNTASLVGDTFPPNFTNSHKFHYILETHGRPLYPVIVEWLGAVLYNGLVEENVGVVGCSCTEKLWGVCMYMHIYVCVSNFVEFVRSLGRQGRIK